MKSDIVVIGGGWAGYAAADALSASPDCHVTLLDAAPAAGGLAGGWRTPGGRPVEAGIHGFWREYSNTFARIESLGLDLDDVLTPFTPSVLVSKSGKVATAPVLAAGAARSSTPPTTSPPPPLAEELAALLVSKVTSELAELLPAPLDTALLAEFPPDSRLTLADRASAVGLLACWADFVQDDPASWARYDDLSAEELFRTYGGVTEALYEELVEPMLHVLPMAPGYDTSAAAALSCFHVFALQSRGAFDVRWCRGGITEQIFGPWQAALEARGVSLQNGARVASISRREADGKLELGVAGGAGGVGSAGAEEAGAAPLLADAVVLAVGGKAMAGLSDASPLLASSALPARRMGGVTCVAVRLYLQPAAGGRTTGLGGGSHGSTCLPREVAMAMEASPVLVVGPKVGGIPELDETGFCVYDLQRLHDEHAKGDEAVLEVDFFRADTLAELDDDALAALALRAASAALGVAPRLLQPELIVDKAIVRARQAVSHFAPGSAAASPAVRLGGGLYAAGDWIDRSGHASWSTEKAVVTGRQAASAVAADLGLGEVDDHVIPPPADTAQLAALRTVAAKLRAGAAAGSTAELPPPAPWAALSSLLGGSTK